MSSPNRNAEVSWKQGKNDVEACIHEIPTLGPNPTMSTLQNDDSFEAPSNNTTLTIEHKTAASTSHGSAKMFGWITKRTLAIAALFLLSSGGCAFFFSQWLEIPGLEDQITKLEGVTSELQTQVDRLEEQNEAFALTNDKLNKTAQRYEELNDELHQNNLRLNDTISGLEGQVGVLSNENDRYERLNQDLASIVTFLNETAVAMDATAEALVDFVAQQIDVYRILVVESIHNTYRQRIATWDCDFYNVFRANEFARNFTMPIGAEMFPLVMDYVDERVLTELCLDREDLELQLKTLVGQNRSLASISIDQLIAGIQVYTEAAIDYYFPDADDEPGGLTPLDWATAGYSCEGLPIELQFAVKQA